MRWHWLPSLLLIPAIALVLMLVVSDRAAAIAILFWPLWLAFRFDNDLGAFFIITVLLYIVFFVIALLFAAIIAIGTYGTIGGI